MFKILVADDDSGMRNALSLILKQGGYDVLLAEDGKAAREIIAVANIDLVISDFQMPYLDGLELLQWVKANKPVPFVLITGFSHILETKQAFDLGAADFFTKPFNYKEILGSVEKLLAPKRPKSVQSPDVVEQEYCRISIEDFVSSATVQISIYVRLSDQKYVRVAHKGDQIPADRVETYRRKGLSYLYAKKEEFGKLVGFNLQTAKVISESDRLGIEKKANFMRYTMELVLEHAAVNGVDEQAFDNAKHCMNVCLSLVTDQNELFNILNVLNSHADWLYGHCLAVSVFSVMIGKKLGFTGQATLFKLSMAGLFHDIGKKEIDLNILVKSRPTLSHEERKLFETHPVRGKEILQDVKEVPSDVIQIVYEHHEECDGRGFPRRVPKERIHPLAKIVAVADVFCNLAVKSPRSEGCHAVKAIQSMQHYSADQLDKSAFAALKSLCQFQSTAF